MIQTKIPKSRIILVVGLSGAGKSVTIDSLSDLGCLSAENIPVPLLGNFIELLSKDSRSDKLAALSLDLSSFEKLKLLMTFLGSKSWPTTDFTILFLDAKTEVIIRRYALTRRPHPTFDEQTDKSLTEAIERERRMLQVLRDSSHKLIDTSELNIHGLKEEVRNFVGSFLQYGTDHFRLNIMSFGFKFGVPIDCDMLLDTRFLRNPYFVEDLKEKTGLNQEVLNFVFQSGMASQFVEKHAELLNFLIPQFVSSGKSYLNLGVGCTGGRHRSVAIGCSLAEKLKDLLHSSAFIVSVKHRDIDKS